MGIYLYKQLNILERVQYLTLITNLLMLYIDKKYELDSLFLFQYTISSDNQQLE